MVIPFSNRCLCQCPPNSSAGQLGVVELPCRAICFSGNNLALVFSMQSHSQPPIHPPPAHPTHLIYPPNHTVAHIREREREISLQTAAKRYESQAPVLLILSFLRAHICIYICLCTLACMKRHKAFKIEAVPVVLCLYFDPVFIFFSFIFVHVPDVASRYACHKRTYRHTHQSMALQVIYGTCKAHRQVPWGSSWCIFKNSLFYDLHLTAFVCC